MMIKQKVVGQHIRPTFAEVSLDAVQHNVKQFSSKLKQNTKLMAVVKAGGYGHGAVPIALAALDAGATHLAVAFIDEAVALRNAGIYAPILILGYTPSYAVELAASMQLSITVFSLEQMQEIASQGLSSKLSIHLKIDTGMSRLGINSLDEGIATVKLVKVCEYTYLEGVFTHFSDADGIDDLFTIEQFIKFTNFLYELESRGINYGLAHCCNSAAIWRFPQFQFDMVRLGIGMYGLQPISDQLGKQPHLKKAMKIKSKISSLKQLDTNVSVSYGRTFYTDEPSVIAVLPIGYADGLSRGLSNVGYVVVRGKRAPIIGRICMDQTMIDVSHIANVRIGDEVTVIGDDSDGITVDDWASWLDTIHYEVVCGISKRVPRIYV